MKIRLATRGSTLPGDSEIINIDSEEKTTIGSCFGDDSSYTLFILIRHFVWPPCHDHIHAVEESLLEFHGTLENGGICMEKSESNSVSCLL